MTYDQGNINELIKLFHHAIFHFLTQLLPFEPEIPAGFIKQNVLFSC
jgi:hypothetical protein